MKVSRVNEMRKLDRGAVERYGIEEKLLMENAGGATYSVIMNEFGISGKKFIVFCGIGNNGGDGCVIARKIHSSGGHVTVFVIGDPEKYSGPAKMNFNILERIAVDIKILDSAVAAREPVMTSDAIVDAIFGTGLARDVTGIHGEVIDLINRSEKPVFCVDIPSGVNGDTGKIMGKAVRGHFTVTYGLPKIGNMLYPGFSRCGRLYVTHISFPPSHYNKESIKIAISDPPMFPKKDQEAHKGDFGEALFIAGAAGYYGAPYFAARSFLRGGGGYARLAAPRSITPFIANKGSEIVFIPLTETASGSIAYENIDDILALSERMDFVVIGPGLSLEAETQKLVREVVREINKPLLIDGDGITAACEDLDIIKGRKNPTILTPHLGEMARITGIEKTEIDRNKIDVLQQTADELQAIIVLKGAHSLIGYPGGSIFINLSGNPGMATAGSGDVLTGTIAAMYGLGLTVEDAVKKGVFIHGFSGDLAAEDLGEDGITAQDILEFLPYAVRFDREGLPDEYRERYRGISVL